MIHSIKHTELIRAESVGKILLILQGLAVAIILAAGFPFYLKGNNYSNYRLCVMILCIVALAIISAIYMFRTNILKYIMMKFEHEIEKLHDPSCEHEINGIINVKNIQKWITFFYYIDLSFLTILVGFTGGIESPFAHIYILAPITLVILSDITKESRNELWSDFGITIFIVITLFFLSYFKFLPLMLNLSDDRLMISKLLVFLFLFAAAAVEFKIVISSRKRFIPKIESNSKCPHNAIQKGYFKEDLCVGHERLCLPCLNAEMNNKMCDS